MSDKYEDKDIEFIYWGDGVQPPEKHIETEIKNEKKQKKAYRKSKRHVKKEYVIVKREIFSLVKLLVCAAVLAFVISNYIIVNAIVPSGSMLNTIHKGDRMIGFRLSYMFSDVERGDVIIFKYPDDESQNFVKRVIGLPGEYIEIIGGRVYINDAAEPLQEDYLLETPTGDFPRTLIPDDCYFLMVDNRNDSHDSRYWSTTNFVKEDQILGKSIFVYWPITKVRIIE